MSTGELLHLRLCGKQLSKASVDCTLAAWRQQHIWCQSHRSGRPTVKLGLDHKETALHKIESLLRIPDGPCQLGLGRIAHCDVLRSTSQPEPHRSARQVYRTAYGMLCIILVVKMASDHLWPNGCKAILNTPQAAWFQGCGDGEKYGRHRRLRWSTWKGKRLWGSTSYRMAVGKSQVTLYRSSASLW